jgi:hypothetical protein
LRTWVAIGVAVATVVLAGCGGAAKSPVTYDSHSLLISGKRVMLNLAEIDYSRLPSADHWPQVLAMAKADGFNAIDTLVPWAYHEPAPGRFRFTGQYDIAKFLAEAAQAGLYVEVRVGPNISGGIDGGGTPGWVLGRPGYLRTGDPQYASLWHKWYGAIVPQIKDYQLGAGKHGTVIMVMAENEYTGDGPSANQFARDLYSTLRRGGITVPISANDFTDQPQLPVEHRADVYGIDQYPLTCSTPCSPTLFGSQWGTRTFSAVRWQKMTTDQDEQFLRANGVTSKPLFAAEFAGGQWPSQFGYGKTTPASLASYLNGYQTVQALTLLGQGMTMITPWTAFGGESWGYSPALEFATTYDWISPIQSTGGAGPRFGEFRIVGEQMQADAPSLAATQVDTSDVTASNPSVLYRVRKSLVDGALHIFLRNADHGPGTSPAATTLTIGRSVTPPVSVVPGSASYLLANAAISGWRLAWSTAQVLMATPRYLVLFGDPGQRYAAVINGRSLNFVAGAPQAFPYGGGRWVVVVNRQDAGRTWAAGSKIVVGPALLLGGQPQTDKPTLQTTIAANGVSRRQLAGPPAQSSLGLPSLTGGWRFAAESPERLPSYDDRSWVNANVATTTSTPVQPITQPVLYADQYGMPTGYVWYRGYFSGRATALCIEGRTRYQVWLNGVSLPTVVPNRAELKSENPFGFVPPQNAQVELRFPATAVHSGQNEISVLTDDWGHNMDVGGDSWAKTPRGLWSAAIDRGSGARCGHFLSGVPTHAGDLPVPGPRPNSTSGGITWKLRGGNTMDYPNASGLLGEVGGWYQPGYDDSRWTPVNLPDKGRLASGEVGWYRTKFSLRLPACTSSGLSLALPGHPGPAEIFLNGVHIGRAGRDAASSYVMPPGVVNTNGTNVLAVARWNLTGSTMPAPRIVVDNLYSTCLGAG